MVLADAFYYTSPTNERIWVSPTQVTLERDEKGRIIKATDPEGRELVHTGMTKNVEIQKQRYRPTRDGGKIRCRYRASFHDVRVSCRNDT